MADEDNYVERKRDYTATLLLCWFLGCLGIHRFYTGYTVIGIIQLLTGGGGCIWALIDFICLCFGNFEDADSNELAQYNPVLGKTAFTIFVILVIAGVLTAAL